MPFPPIFRTTLLVHDGNDPDVVGFGIMAIENVKWKSLQPENPDTIPHRSMLARGIKDGGDGRFDSINELDPQSAPSLLIPNGRFLVFSQRLRVKLKGHGSARLWIDSRT